MGVVRKECHKEAKKLEARKELKIKGKMQEMGGRELRKKEEMKDKGNKRESTQRRKKERK